MYLFLRSADFFPYPSIVIFNLRISPISRSSIDAMELRSSQAAFTAPVLPPKSQAHQHQHQRQQQHQQAVSIQRHEPRQQSNPHLGAGAESGGLTARLGKNKRAMALSTSG